MFASTVIGSVPLPSPLILAGVPTTPHDSGPRGERGEAARTDTAPTRASHRGEETDAAEATEGAEPLTELRQYDIIARTATVGAHESLRSPA